MSGHTHTLSVGGFFVYTLFQVGSIPIQNEGFCKRRTTTYYSQYLKQQRKKKNKSENENKKQVNFDLVLSIWPIRKAISFTRPKYLNTQRPKYLKVQRPKTKLPNRQTTKCSKSQKYKRHGQYSTRLV